MNSPQSVLQGETSGSFPAFADEKTEVKGWQCEVTWMDQKPGVHACTCMWTRVHVSLEARGQLQVSFLKLFLFFCFFVLRTPLAPLPAPPWCGDYRCVSQCLASPCVFWGWTQGLELPSQARYWLCHPRPSIFTELTDILTLKWSTLTVPLLRSIIGQNNKRLFRALSENDANSIPTQAKIHCKICHGTQFSSSNSKF